MLKRGWLWSALALLALSTGACSGDYPLEPTPCDDFCNLTQGNVPYCFNEYDPAQCVVQCETEGLSRPACSRELEALLECFRSKPTAVSDQCNDDFGFNSDVIGCQLVSQSLYGCLEADGLGLFGGS